MAGVLTVLSLSGGFLPGLAQAATEVVPLERLRVRDVILLPTVTSQYETEFTRPKTWQLAGTSALYLEFQHSIELLPNRSWLQVIVNDKVIQHIPLTHENAEGTKMTIPLPVGLLKDFNRLAFRVEQHYTDHCEDPLDKSLWTQILPATKMVFNYTPVVPQVALNSYPYPIIDPLTYSPARVHYVTASNASEKELQALAYVNVHLAQEAQKHEMRTRVTFGNVTGADNEHVALVGTPNNLPDLARFQGAFGAYALQGGQWVDRSSGQPLAANQGVILFFQAPGSTEHTVLVVSGNSDEAVLNGARYLTTRPRESALNGNAQVVPAGWSEPGTRTAKVPRFVETQTRSFRELGFKNEEVHKINAPPITYPVPVVSKFRQSGGKLFLDLVYSYSPNLNPEFSSLELRMNDISIANVPLLNPAGEELQRISVPISSELVRPRNELVAQFHLMPDKYGWCVDNYVDNAWGKIMDDSQLRVEGGPGSYLPDVGLLNNMMYPYSKEDNLSTVQLALPASPSVDVLNAMLGFTTRLGRVTLADTDLRFSLSKGGAVAGDRDAVVFRQASDSMSLPEGAKLVWQGAGNALMRLLTLADPMGGQMSGSSRELGSGAYLEQYKAGGSQIISVLTATQPQGFTALAQRFEVDKQFDELVSGMIQQGSLLNQQLNAVTPTAYHIEQQNAVGAWWQHPLEWLKSLSWGNIMIGLVLALCLLILLPILVRAIFRRR